MEFNESGYKEKLESEAATGKSRYPQQGRLIRRRYSHACVNDAKGIPPSVKSRGWKITGREIELFREKVKAKSLNMIITQKGKSVIEDLRIPLEQMCANSVYAVRFKLPLEVKEMDNGDGEWCSNYELI